MAPFSQFKLASCGAANVTVIVEKLSRLEELGYAIGAYFYFRESRLLMPSVPLEYISHWVSAGCFLSSLWGCCLAFWRCLCSRASWLSVLGECLFPAIVTQLVLGSGLHSVGCQAGGIGRGSAADKRTHVLIPSSFLLSCTVCERKMYLTTTVAFYM